MPAFQQEKFEEAVPTNLSKAKISELAGQLAEKFQYRTANDLECIVDKLGGRIDIPIYRPTAAVPIPATPVSYLFRSGTCVLGLCCAYWLEQWRSRRPPLADAAPGWQKAMPCRPCYRSTCW